MWGNTGSNKLENPRCLDRFPKAREQRIQCSCSQSIGASLSESKIAHLFWYWCIMSITSLRLFVSIHECTYLTFSPLPLLSSPHLSFSSCFSISSPPPLPSLTHPAGYRHVYLEGLTEASIFVHIAVHDIYGKVCDHISTSLTLNSATVWGIKTAVDPRNPTASVGVRFWLCSRII